MKLTYEELEREFCEAKELIHAIRNGHVDTIIGEGKNTLRLENIKLSEEREQLIQELQAAKEKAEKATKLKDKFITLVSHDLKAPLSTMIGMLQLTRTKMEESPETKKAFEISYRSATNMLSLIDDLLNISRFKTGALRLNLKFIDLHFVVSKVKHDFAPLAGKKGVELVSKVPRNTRVYSDISLFYEVINNLVSNSIKFCEKGDKITLFVPGGETSTLAITDTGKGILQESIGSLFQYEIKTSTRGTAGESGMGLGLPLCHDIITAHGGTINVESRLNEGSTFFVKLPPVKPKILIVEDDNVIRKAVQGMLQGEDTEIITALDGKEALEVLKVHTPHLILLDLVLPKMDGFEILRRLGEDTKWTQIPVIIMTADKKREIQEQAFELGADDFISKPFSSVELIPRVMKLLYSWE